MLFGILGSNMIRETFTVGSLRGFPAWGTPSYHALIHRIFHEINQPSITWGTPIFGNIQWQPSGPKVRFFPRLAGCSIPEATRAEQLWDLAVQVGVLI